MSGVGGEAPLSVSNRSDQEAPPHQLTPAASSAAIAVAATHVDPSSPHSPADHYTVSSPVAHALRRNSLAAIAAQQMEHHNQAEFSLAAGSPSSAAERSGSESDGEDSGALLRQNRARAASRQEIAARYTMELPSSSRRSARDSCDIPTIFNSTEEDADYARSEEPLLGEWQLRAAAAVIRHRESSQRVYNQSPWSVCSLSFRDPQAEQAFHYYFSSLNEHKLRRRLLLLNFLYMIYATIEWGTRTSKHYTQVQQNWITVLRVFYILVNAIMFTVSFVRRNVYRRNINLFSTILAVLTSTLIIIEGHLLRNIYSPFVLFILIMYMVGSNIYVRTLFSVSVAVCWYNMILYNFMCLVFNPNGDLSTLHSTNAALLQLFYYDIILVFFILTIMFQTRKVEKQNRYAFLTYYVEAEAEQEEQRAAAAAAASAGGEGGKKKKKKKSSSSKDSNEPSSPLTEEKETDAHPTAAAPGGRHLLPRTKEEELALLRELNAAERAEDPFYLSRVADVFLPHKQVTHQIRLASASTEEKGLPPLEPPPGSITHREADGSLTAVTTTSETVYSNDPLYSTLSIMRSKGITSMTDFVRHLAHQNKVAEASKQIREMPCMCCINELPSWFTSYPYVLSKYRTNYTRGMCLRSMFEWHNETINIWTEFIPCLVFLIAIIIMESADPVVFSSKTDPTDRFFVTIGLLFSVIVRPICSGLAHTFYCMSNRAFIIWWSIDYVSILMCIMGYALVMGRLTFYCMLSQQIFFYISVIVLFLSTIASVLFVASPGIRTSSFLLYVLFANGVPYIYQIVLSAADLEQHNVPNSYLVLWTVMWSLMLVGLLVKSAMIPERWFPGRFDIFFHSHQWWHLFVNAGAAMAYFTWKNYLLWRPNAPCDPAYGVADTP